MNKRIAELKDQCYICLIDRNDDNEYDMEKFAELIVKECLGKISGLMIEEEIQDSDEINPYRKWNLALAHAEFEIEQHFFGVER